MARVANGPASKSNVPPLGRLPRRLIRTPVKFVFAGFLGHGEGWSGQVDHLAELQPEPFGHLDQRGEADVELPAGFDLLVMLVGKPGALGECLLGQAACLPEFPDSCQ